MRENVRFVIHPATENERAIDIELELTALTEPVQLTGAAGKGYGGLSLRFAPRLQTTITTATGRQPTDLNLTPLEWADLSAKFENSPGQVGVAIFVNPRHPRFPPTWVTRHYGVLGVGWPGVDPHRIEPGKSVPCRYRLLIHRGAADIARLQRSYEAFCSIAPRFRG